MEKKITFGVIILNYFSYQETINCVDSFQKANSTDYNVYLIIVDNGSSNDSYSILSKKFELFENINVIKVEKNIGFANGNNVGLDFLKKNYMCDYFIFSNSDILVKPDIFKWIEKSYKKNKCDILGPDIYAKRLGIHQNPIKKYTENPFMVNLKIYKKKIEIFALKFHIPWPSKKLSLNRIGLDSKKKQVLDCPVHGSFIVTNNKFLDFYKDFFDNRTFLYMEEYLLYLRCKKAKLKTMVSLDHQVIHLQGKSTDSNMNNARKKRINRLNREISSMKIYNEELCKKESEP